MFKCFKYKKQHYIKDIKLTDHITLVIFGYTFCGKDYNKSCYLQFNNGEIYPIV